MGRFKTLVLALFAFSSLSLGQPRGHHGVGHRHRVKRGLFSKGQITISDASIPERTELPELVVYVDQYGHTLTSDTEMVVFVPEETPAPESSSTSVAAPSTTLSSSTSAVSSSVTLSSPVPASAPPVLTPAAPTTAAPTAATAESMPEPSSEASVDPSSAKQFSSEAPVAPSALASSSLPSAPAPVSSAEPDVQSTGFSELHGVTYSPYKHDGNCKTAAEVDRDFALFSKDYGTVRIYGVDCNQVSTVSKAAKKYGNKLFLGLYDIRNIDSGVATMAASLDHDWSMVDTVSVGNEVVNDGTATVGQSLAALSQARAALRAAGYQGPVVVVDTFVAVLNHPELCDQSDYCAINIHPFFDRNTGAPEAGSFVNSIVSDIRAKLADPNKRIVVTETGWPWQGLANGAAVPGLDHQATAIASIKSTFSTNAADVFLFTAFNDMWKKPEAGTFMAEQYWGMGGRYSPCDQ